jgi:hypothetical protein
MFRGVPCHRWPDGSRANTMFEFAVDHGIVEWRDGGDCIVTHYSRRPEGGADVKKYLRWLAVPVIVALLVAGVLTGAGPQLRKADAAVTLHQPVRIMAMGDSCGGTRRSRLISPQGNVLDLDGTTKPCSWDQSISSCK